MSWPQCTMNTVNKTWSCTSDNGTTGSFLQMNMWIVDITMTFWLQIIAILDDSSDPQRSKMFFVPGKINKNDAQWLGHSSESLYSVNPKQALSNYRCLLSGRGCSCILLGCSPLVRSARPAGTAGAANDNLAWLLRLMLISTPPPGYHRHTTN